MASPPHLSAPPVLSTPESHVFEDPTPLVDPSSLPQLSDEEVIVRYEIQRTIREIREGRWKRIALQFPDEMVGDGVRVYRFLKRGLVDKRREERQRGSIHSNGNEVEPARASEHGQTLEQDLTKLDIKASGSTVPAKEEEHQLSILADTSYGSCCVDEIAAEHVDAEVVVHYGRSCLSPTARLPVIYVFTTRELDANLAIQAFKETYSDKEQKVVLMGDLPYHEHLEGLAQRLREDGYTTILVPDVVHDPSSLLPNRILPSEIQDDSDRLKEYALFHTGQPPPALLLTLASRVSSIHIYDPTTSPKARAAISTAALRRRYALLTSLSTVSIFGILINTLSVKNYLHVVSHVSKLITAAGKKSYTFVVGKVNPAKIANFAEIGGWVVIGCWESSLVESRDFYRPLITPFELELALTSDRERLWSGSWRSDFDAVLSREIKMGGAVGEAEGDEKADSEAENADEDEDAPPEFDLRTGRYVSHSRPMRAANGNSKQAIKSRAEGSSQSLIKRADGQLAQVGGVASPGAEFLQSVRSWKGLGSDYEIAYDEPGAVVEEGRSGVARGYVVGSDGVGTKH
jgi:diphthamide biosynthesis protein 2